MTHTQLPILGAGSQADDGLDYMRMPSEMTTYMAPEIPEAEEVRGLTQGMAALEQLFSQLDSYDGKPLPTIALKNLDDANRRLVDQVLGEGEVSIVIDGSPKTLIQESVLAGVWRVQRVDESDVVLSDHIEVAPVPREVSKQGFSGAQNAVNFSHADANEGVMNAPPLLAEINEQIPLVSQNGGSHAINLSLLPQTEQDLAFLQQVLGAGRIVILSRGYGNCRITNTHTQNVWWVQYFNSQDTMILNTLEICEVPEVACAAAEDIADSAQRLNEILEVYRA